jgi:hypothetical protein
MQRLFVVQTVDPLDLARDLDMSTRDVGQRPHITSDLIRRLAKDYIEAGRGRLTSLQLAPERERAGDAMGP